MTVMWALKKKKIFNKTLDLNLEYKWKVGKGLS